MRQIKIGILVLLAAFGACGLAVAAEAETLAEHVEMLDWTDPERAEQFLSAEPVPEELRHPDLLMLEVIGMVYSDVQRDADFDDTLSRLDALAKRGAKGAALAAHYLRGYSLYQLDQFTAASAELSQIDVDGIASLSERYRVAILKGNILQTLGQVETALPLFEKAMDVAHEMHDDTRGLHAKLLLARIYTNAGTFERATELLESARHLATISGDEAALVEVEGRISDIADRQGNRIEERRASLAALEHARRSGSNKWLAQALVNLGDSYLKSRDYSESLRYSKEAMPVLARLRQSGDESIVSFNEGLAYIGLGNIKLGEKLAESAIAQALASDDVLDGKEYLREYADALEHAGYLMMAIQVYHRYDAASEKFMTNTRQRTFLELSAKFDDERRARELELLRRDNDLKASEMREQRLQQQLILAATIFVTCLCAALVWAIVGVRKANNRLRFDSERDALTGLRNRRYFNDNILAVDGARPVAGCVLLADLDHFKRINDTLGHPAGDAVLATVSHRLSAALRESDRLVRWGGEEFLAILDPITREQADLTVLRLLQAVRRDPVLWNGAAIQCTISIGYGFFPMAGWNTPISLDSAITLVDKALYEAKRRGRDRACLISAVSAHAEFESATADLRIQLVETGVAA